MNNPLEDVYKLTTKFLFLNCIGVKREESCSELNDILNELNSFACQSQKLIDEKSGIRLAESLTSILPSDEETIVVKSCFLLTSLVAKQKLQLPAQTFHTVLQWLIQCLNAKFPDIADDVLKGMHTLLKYHSVHIFEIRDSLLDSEGPLVKLLAVENNRKIKKNYVGSSSEEIFQATISCIESLMPPADEIISDELIKNLTQIGTKVIQLFYSVQTNSLSANSSLTCVVAALVILQRVAAIDRDWLEKNIGETLGIAKSYMLYGISDIEVRKPQKVIVSQQSILEPVLRQINKGGKVLKSRKPRNVSKNKKECRSKLTKGEDYGQDNMLKFEYDNALLSSFYKTSESDFSESESGRSQKEMHKQAKLRLAAISLICSTTRNCDKKLMYGYWHSIFPSEPLNATSQDLLSCVIRDPNPRCRVAALQATSILLSGSKPYLAQAETRTAPSTFTPFSISLGNTILSIYESLAQALSSESSLPVLTQILKCLGIFIQATPFHRLDNKFIGPIIKYIRRLIYHKDSTIQVAALMVMEFLISVQDMPNEISVCIGIPKSKLNLLNKNKNQLNDAGANDIIQPHDDEEIIDSDDEVDTMEEAKDVIFLEENKSTRMSWLLQKVLENLGVSIGSFKQSSVLAAAPVRIECLQIMSNMAAHFLLLKDHLEFIETALEKSLNDPQAEIRHYSGKSLDTIGHSMSAFLLENVEKYTDVLSQCVNFWVKILPFVILKIQDQSQNSTLKVSLCDFLSNIGIHVFERLPHNMHIQLISLLSGTSCNEENTVRASAVRALAVYALFPSLRDDLCFIENTAEAIIPLLKDSNLFVRVKASWAMGNISDALVANITDLQGERISNDLFRRIVEISAETGSDNDKVRSNAVRTLGNLVRLFTAEHLIVDSWQLLFKKSIQILVQNLDTGNNAKVKWNACYAIGNFMKNELIFNSVREYDWQSTVFMSLTKAIVHNANFKVRINGTAALSVIKKREFYGKYLSSIWSSLLLALEQSRNLVDFNEYKHRDSLQEQICITLSHVIKVCNREDLVSIKNELVPVLEATKQTWQRVVNRVLPEHAAPLLSCSIYLNELLQKPHLQNETKNAIQILASCFVYSSNTYI